ncbi:hypothetical protein [Actinomadura alba]|uniref:Spore-associated protein A n=1 Tax=Actinomadura alba TaxID=406431 RepID=A0ABR7LWC1_9ACTN|nr:hypothetical protein [Actinomadura alba]MBC6468775.1 hypothetical protein [Actinomadura alba]
MRENVTKKLLGLACSLTVGAGLLVGTAGPATAATCSGTHLRNWGITGGYIAVYYNSATRRNCAMTFTNKPGTYQYMYVAISGPNGSDKDDGKFQYYAGPVETYAPGACISLWGQVGHTNPTEGIIDVHCG